MLFRSTMGHQCQNQWFAISCTISSISFIIKHGGLPYFFLALKFILEAITWTYLDHNGTERNEGELVLLLNGGVPVTHGIIQAIRGLAWKVGQNGII